MTHYPLNGRGCGHVTILKLCRREGLSATAELLVVCLIRFITLTYCYHCFIVVVAVCVVCVQSSLEVHCRTLYNRETAEDAEFLGDMGKSPKVVAGKPALLRHLSGLLFSPVIEDCENTPASAADDGSDVCKDDNNGKTSAVRGLFRSPSVPCRVSRAQSGYLIGRRNCQKRGETDQSPAGVEAKRQRNSCESVFPHTENMSVPCSSVMPSSSSSRSAGRQRLHRSHSETEVMIKCALSRAELHPDLIGDFSKPYCLPLISSAKHPDLKAISPATVRLLLHILSCKRKLSSGLKLKFVT